MSFLVNLQSLRVLGTTVPGLPRAGVETKRSQRLDFEDALELGDFRPVHERLQACSRRGVIDWKRFDITEFGAYMPSMATFKRVETAEGEIDFVYGYSGENINRVAKRPLRGLSLREVLTGPSRAEILAEYTETLAGETPSASTGSVDISDMYWVRYLRFIYPVLRNGEVGHLLIFMLFASRSDATTHFAKTPL